MCGKHTIDYGLARAGAERILQHHGIPVAKVNPLDDDDFVTLTDRFTRELQRASGPIDRRAVQDAIDTLNVPWNQITPEVQAGIIAAASRALNVGPAVAETVAPVLGSQMRRTVQETKQAVGEQLGIRLGFTFDQVDRNIAANVLRSQSSFVTNEYRVHQRLFSQRAREIIGAGLDAGLRPEAITADLASAARAIGLNRPANYWRVTASAATNRARTLTQLTNYRGAGVDRYEFQAIMDQRTTDICRLLDGRVFNVADSLEGFKALDNAASFDAVKDIQPWVRARKNEDGTKLLFIKQRNGTEVPVAQVDKSAVGKVDQRGVFSKAMGNSDLSQFGLIQPPLHGL